MANSYLNRTKGTSTSTTKGTYSFWFKLSKTTGVTLIENGTATADRAIVYIDSNSKLKIFSKIGNSTKLDLGTNRVFRDVSAWYHLVLAIDTTQGTSSNRVKVYVNGVQETSFASATYPDQNDALRFFTSSEIEEIGIDLENGGLFEGYMSHVVKVDGQQLAPTTFGETDSTSGIWKFKPPSGVTWGNNGFHLKFENSGALGTDSSGNSNTFTVNGNLKQGLDTPSNVYATWNILYKNSSTFSNGNTTSASGSSGEFNSASTLGMSSGKWYMEFKRVSGNYPIFGIVDDIALAEYSNANMGLGKTGTTKSIGLRLNDGKTRVNNVVTTQGGSIANGDIVGVAVDKTTNKIYFSKNGQWSNGSGAWDSTTFNASTGATDVSSILTGGTWFFACGTDTGEASNTFSANFGNGFFGTTAITSAGSNGNGSLFEYDVPSGYYALNTKNINTYG